MHSPPRDFTLLANGSKGFEMQRVEDTNGRVPQNAHGLVEHDFAPFYAERSAKNDPWSQFDAMSSNADAARCAEIIIARPADFAAGGNTNMVGFNLHVAAEDAIVGDITGGGTDEWFRQAPRYLTQSRMTSNASAASTLI